MLQVKTTFTILPSDNNYYMQLRDYKIGFESDRDPFVLASWQKVSGFLTDNLYETWINTTHNGKTIKDIHEDAGYNPIYIKLEDVIDVYGGGIYGPHGITNFLDQNPNLKNICLGSASTGDMKKFNWHGSFPNAAPYVQRPGVPTGYFHGSQCGFTSSDDIYLNWDMSTDRVIARIPVFYKLRYDCLD